MTNPAELLACPVPWCGGGAEEYRPDEIWYAVRCKKCGLSTEIRSDDWKAFQQWNTR